MLSKIAGFSGLSIGLGYIIIIALFMVVGAKPTNGAEWLAYFADNTKASIWWIIILLSIVTDILFIPMLAGVYQKLKGTKDYLVWAGIGAIILFVLLDLAVTWPNYAGLIAISGNYANATTELAQTLHLAAATYANTIVTSPILSAYIILLPGLGILAIGLAMLKTQFGKTTSYAAIATGVFAVVAVVGGLFSSAAGFFGAVAASALTLAWCMFVGARLIKQPQLKKSSG